MNESTGSACSEAEVAGELVFIYGHQWRGGLMMGQLNRAEIVGGGCVKGRLLSIAEQPAMVLDEGTGQVRGEVYRISQEHLEELDKIMETVAKIVGNGRCQRSRIMVSEVKLNAPPMEAWSWLWDDLEGQYQLVPSGDWLSPGATPLFTWLAFSCLVAGPLLLIAVLFVEEASISRSGTRVGTAFPSWVFTTVMVLFVTAPMAGLYSAYLAHRRKERWSGCLTLIVIALVVLLILITLSFLKRLN